METEPRPSALLLAPETPYPIAGGGALRTASLLHYLAGRYDTDLIVFRQPGAADPNADLPPGLVRKIHVIDLPRHRRGRFARTLRNAGRLARQVPPLVDRFAGFEVAIRNAAAARHYHVGIVEHSWCAPYLTQLAPACAHTVLDLHNVESVLHARCADQESGAAAFAHRAFRHASLEIERQWLPRYSQVLASSSADAAVARSIAPRAHVSVYPNALPWTPLPETAAENVIVFSGNMEYHPNRIAVRFFRSEVWPLLRDRWPGLVWRLVGKNPDAIRDLTSGDSRIEIRGPVEDAILELARARVAVVPIRAASGTRLKILEAWAAGVPVVSTTMGAEGLPARDGEELLLADTPSAMAEAISRLLTCTVLGQHLRKSGRLLMEREFTWETVWPKLGF